MTVRSSAASAPLKSRNCCVMIGWPLSFSVVSDQATSCAVSGVPSWNFASGRSEEAVGQPVIGDPHARRGKSVHRVGLVARARHQGGEGEIHPERALALEDVSC